MQKSILGCLGQPSCRLFGPECTNVMAWRPRYWLWTKEATQNHRYLKIAAGIFLLVQVILNSTVLLHNIYISGKRQAYHFLQDCSLGGYGKSLQEIKGPTCLFVQTHDRGPALLTWSSEPWGLCRELGKKQEENLKEAQTSLWIWSTTPKVGDYWNLSFRHSSFLEA